MPSGRQSGGSRSAVRASAGEKTEKRKEEMGSRWDGWGWGKVGKGWGGLVTWTQKQALTPVIIRGREEGRKGGREEVGFIYLFLALIIICFCLMAECGFE